MLRARRVAVRPQHRRAGEPPAPPARRRRARSRDHQDGARRGLRARRRGDEVSADDAGCRARCSARMVLVLLAGLIVAQLASFAMHWRERGEFMYAPSGMRSAAAHRRHRRAARLARAGRARKDRRRVQLAAAAHFARRAAARAARGRPGEGGAGGAVHGGDPRARSTTYRARGASGRSGCARRFRQRPGMRGGRERERAEGGAGRGEAGVGGPAMRRFGASFIVQARLTDGTLITFDARAAAGIGDVAVSIAAEPRGAARRGYRCHAARGALGDQAAQSLARGRARPRRRHQPPAARRERAARSAAAPRARSTRCSSGCRNSSATARASSPRCRTT